MKKSKERFDGLVERIRKGESVSFGQMEDVFAQAFLSRFLKRLSSEQERSKANEFYREHLIDDPEAYEDEYGEQPELSSGQQIHYELEIARSVMGTLGVRPTTEDLSPYIEHAVSGRDWKLLDMVLSLTQEGSIGKVVVERVALEDLVRGRETSYTELREHFGDWQFSEAVVRPLYELAAKERNFEGIERVRNETHFPVPEEICWDTYESLLENFSERTIPQLKALRQATDVSPARTEVVRNNLLKVFSEVDLTPQDMDSLDELFAIYSQKANSPLFQRAALDAGHFRTFEHLYTKSEGKIAEIRLKERYKEWDEKGDSEQIFHILEVTGVQPTKEILNRGYNDFFAKMRYSVIRRVAEKTGRKPQLDEDKIKQAVEEQINGHYGFSLHPKMNARDLLNTLQISQNGVDPSIVERYAVTYMEGKSRDKSFKVREIYEEIKDFCNAYKVGVPAEDASKMLEGMVIELVQQVTEAERSDGSGRSPLRPVRGKNLSDFKKFRGRMRELVREYSKTIADVKGENQSAQIEKTEQISNLYRTCLELVLVQCEQEENPAVDMNKFAGIIGVPLAEDVAKNAVLSYINRLAILGYDKERGKEIQGIIDKVNGLKLGIDFNDRFHEETASVLASSENRVGSHLAYFADMTGKSTFSPETQEKIWRRRLESLIRGNFEDYDLLSTFVERREFTAEEKEKIRQGTVAYARTNIYRLEDIDKISSRIGFQLTASPDELSDVVREYFRSWMNNQPTKISSRFHAELDPEQIRERYNFLLHSQIEKANTKSRIEVVRELKKDTGIPADQQVLKQFIFHNLSVYAANELSELFEIDFSQEDLDTLYREAFKTGGSTEHKWALQLMKTQDTAPSNPVAEEIIRQFKKQERYNWNENYREFVKSMTKLYGVKAPDEIVQRIKEQAFKEPGIRNSDLIARLRIVHELYNRADIVSEEEAKKVVELVDNEFTTNLGNQNRQSTNTEEVSYIYRIAGKQVQANKLATRLFEGIRLDSYCYHSSLFNGYAYCAITGAKPSIPVEQLGAIKAALGRSAAGYIFKTEQFEQFKKMVNEWIKNPSTETAEETEPARIEVIAPVLSSADIGVVRPSIYTGLNELEQYVVKEIVGNDLYDENRNLIRRHAIGLSFLYEVVFDEVKSREKYQEQFQTEKRGIDQSLESGSYKGEIILRDIFSRDSLEEVSSDEFWILFNMRRGIGYSPLKSMSEEIFDLGRRVRGSLHGGARIVLDSLLPTGEDGKLWYFVSSSPNIRRRETKNNAQQIAIASAYLMEEIGGQ